MTPAAAWDQTAFEFAVPQLVGLSLDEMTGEQAARWESLISQSADVAVVADRHTAQISYVSPAVTRLFGWQREQLMGRPSRSLAHPGDAEMLEKALCRVRADPDCHPTLEFRLACADGSFRWVEGTISNMSEVPGIRGMVANIHDITDRRSAESAARTSDNRYRLIAETAQEGIWACDYDGKTLFANQKLADLLGWPLADIYARPSDELLSSMSRQDVVERQNRRNRDGIEIFEQLQIGPDGSHRILRFSAVAFDDDGRRLGALAMISDVTDSRALEQELRLGAFHDPLTGAANRSLLLERLTEVLRPVESTAARSVAVLVADLDQFKFVNDSFGHSAGDELLVEVARRWQGLLRPADTLARLGGDEFVVVCHESESVAAEIATRLLRALDLPISLAGRSAAISASIGIAAVTTGAGLDAGVDASTLLGYGDLAMYEAKSKGRGRIAVFTPRLAERARDRLHLLNDLKEALAGDELDLAYQPVVELATGQLLGVEALCRWTHPVRGVVIPDEFIPIAEETGLIEQLDGWVLRRSCREAAAMRAAGVLPDRGYLAVNVSAGHLARPGFEAAVRAALSDAGLPAGALVLEVTESAIMRDPEAARMMLESLRALGVEVSIDDFGTGYSSLAYLRRLPVGNLKIDRSFIQHVNENPDDRAIVTAVIDLARALNLTTTAEGIETAADLALLQELGCVAGQGFLWSPAVSSWQLAKLLDRLPHGRFVVTPTAAGPVEPIAPSLPAPRSSVRSWSRQGAHS